MDIQQQNNRTRTLTDCGIMAALSVVLIFFMYYVPFIGFLASFVWAVPLMVLSMRQSLPVAALTALVIAAVAVLIAGPLTGLLGAVSVAGFGLLYGFCFRQKIAPLRALLWGVIVAVVLTALSLVFSASLGGLSLSALPQQLEAAYGQAMQMYADMGMLDMLLPQGMTQEEYLQTLVSTIQVLLPGLVVLSGMLMATINYLVATAVLRRLRFDIRALPPFTEWHFSWVCLWGLIIALVAWLMHRQFGGEYYVTIATTVLCVYVPLCLISGIALAAYFFKRFKLSRGAQIFIWIIAVLISSYALPFLVIFGVVDMVLDYRKLMRSRDELRKQGGS